MQTVGLEKEKGITRELWRGGGGRGIGGADCRS